MYGAEREGGEGDDAPRKRDGWNGNKREKQVLRVTRGYYICTNLAKTFYRPSLSFYS